MGRLQDFPTTEQLLVSGGDARIALDPLTGLNKYACQAFPDPGLLSFSSSTASVISEAAYAAANVLRERLLCELEYAAADDIYAREMQRIRQELLSDVADLDVELAFAASGTDAHFLAAQIVARASGQSIKVVMVEEDETGSGVASALSALGGQYSLTKLPLRQPDGTPRSSSEIDAGVLALVNAAVGIGQRVLLIMVDQSKTGLIAPSVDCVMALQRRYPEQLDVLVDACQFRLAPETLRAYLQQGFMLALTGSKFLTGPSFSAALLLPAKFSQQSVRPSAANFGLLLRWEAALVELRRFRAVPRGEIIRVTQAFAQAVQLRLMSDPNFESLAVPPLERGDLLDAQSWDHLPTIFPFLLYHPTRSGERIPFSREATLQVYRQLQVNMSSLDGVSDGVSALRCQFGQPVACGVRNGIAVSALRLCLSARLISDACEKNDTSGLIEDVMRAMHKASLLVASQTANRKPFVKD
jgi:hypothetical protein